MLRNRRSYCLFGIIFLFALISDAYGQTPSPTPKPTPSLEKEFFKNIFHDQKAIWMAPLTLDRGDAKWLVPASVGTMALITTDRISGDEIAEFELGKGSRIISYAGSIYGVAAVEASFYFIGRKKNDDRARETGILAAEASVDTSIVVSALKLTSQRVRPDEGADRSEFLDRGSSFPSGHSAQAWALATVIANEYHDRPWVQITAYSVASAVSIARFTGGKHYLSDVLVGSGIGYGIGKYLYRTHHRRTKSTVDDGGTSRWPVIRPEFNPGGHEYGIGLTWGF
jgi:PAP2 superfamily